MLSNLHNDIHKCVHLNTYNAQCDSILFLDDPCAIGLLQSMSKVVLTDHNECDGVLIPSGDLVSERGPASAQNKKNENTNSQCGLFMFLTVAEMRLRISEMIMCLLALGTQL